MKVSSSNIRIWKNAWKPLTELVVMNDEYTGGADQLTYFARRIINHLQLSFEHLFPINVQQAAVISKF